MPEMPVMASPGALFAMCAAMMTAMMLPGALLQIARRGVLFGAGYLLVWTGFSAVATLVQVELDRAGLLSEAMALRSVPLAALVVAAADSISSHRPNARVWRVAASRVPRISEWRPDVRTIIADACATASRA